MAERERPRREEGDEVSIRNVIPVPADTGSVLVRSLRSWLKIEGKESLEREQIRSAIEGVESIASLAYTVSVPWLSEAGIATTVEPEGFKSDVKRKLVGAAGELKKTIQDMLGECMEVVELLEEPEDRQEQGLERLAPADRIGEHASLTERLLKAIELRCGPAIELGLDSMYAYALAVDIILGAVQVNLPASIMPNAHKIRLGVMTD